MSYTLDFPIQYIPNPDRLATIGLGELYIGVVDGDPAAEPADRVQVYIARQNDTDLPISQPIELSAGGVPVYLGSPVTLKINQSFSVAVLDKNGAQVYYSPKTGEIIDSINDLEASIGNIETIVENLNLESALTIDKYLDLSAYSPTVDNIYYLKEFNAGTGVGGGNLIAKAGAITPDNLDTFASAIPGVYFERVNKYSTSSYDSGAVDDGVTNDALNYIKLSSKLQVEVDGRAVVSGGTTPLISDNVDTVFHGDGRIDTMYRKQVIPRNSMSTDMSCVDIVPAKHLMQYCIAATLGRSNVCLLGDSISTWSANTFMRGDMLSGVLESVLQRQTPGAFNYYNRAIGGKTYGDVFGVQFNASIAWYNTPGAPWIDYVDATNPDLVFISFGMNDANAISFTAVKALIDYLQAKTKPPSIVLITNLVPCPKSVSMVPTAKIAMEAREQAAGFVRSYAKFRGVGLIDINRKASMAQDGFDPLSTVNKLSASGVPRITAGANYTWTRPQQCSDWFVAPSWNDSNTGWSFTINTGTHANDYIQVFRDATNLLISFVSQGTAYANSTIPYTFANAAGQHLAFEKKGNRLMVYRLVNAAYQDPIVAFPLVSNGGIFDIIVSCPIATPIDGVDIHASEYIQNNPSIRNSKLWGDESAVFNEYMGSGFNHPSHFAAGHIYRPLIEGIQFYERITLKGTIAVPSGSTNVAVFFNNMVTANAGFNVNLTAKTGAPGVPFRVEFPATNGFSIYFSGATTANTNIMWEVLQ